ncbi:MAG: nuclear transport factor 2 family protein [Actinobacteria bacterium]|nr:nuclear transport factor 2 family protein [Actinomycetota bacterium]
MSDVEKAHEVIWGGIGVRVEDHPDAAPVAKDCLFILPGVTVRGMEKARPYFAAYLGAYPDTVKRVKRIVRDDQAVVIRSTVLGHNTGSLVTSKARSEPTGQEVEWDIVEWLVVEHGVIVEWRVYQDSTPFIDVLNNLDADAERRAQLAARQPCIADVVTSTRVESPAGA